MPYLSLVVPVFNEEENLLLLFESITQALAGLPQSWELVLVDDGSSDGSPRILEELARKDPEHVRVILFRRNFGQTAAIAAGIDHAQGEVLVFLDADMQNDPADIPMMLAKLDEGYDVVSGWRKHRQDFFLTRTLPSNIANALISWVTGVRLHDYGCTLKIYRREVLGGFRLYGEMHRFIPVYAYSAGAKIVEVPVQHHPRTHGKTKYGLERTVKVILDLFTVRFLLSYFHKPIYLFGGTGIGLMIISAATLVFLMIRRLMYTISPFDSPFFQVSAMFFILGFQSILMGLIAEMQVRTYHEAQGKPTYRVRKKFNLPDADPKPKS
jgi:glycosyltransferase involved in cell wall biosynthesis